MAKMFGILFVLLVAVAGWTFSSSSAIMSARVFYDDDTGKMSYVVNARYGIPTQHILLRVDFSLTNVILFHRSIIQKSVSYSQGTDIIHLGMSDIYRVPVLYDPSYLSDECLVCDGVIGLGPQSFVWYLWSSASITPGFILFGKVHDLMTGAQSQCKDCIIKCAEGQRSGLCTGQAYSELTGKTYPIRITSSGSTRLPSNLYRAYMSGKNVFNDDETDWAPLSLAVNGISHFDNSEIQQYLVSRGINIEKCKSHLFDLDINPGDIVTYSRYATKKYLNVEESTEDYIEIGLNSWKNYLIYYDIAHGLMVLKQHSTSRHVTTTNLVIFSILFWLFVRWKTYLVSFSLENIAAKGATSKLNFFYQLSAIPLVIVAYILPDTREIMDDFPFLYTITGVAILLYTVLQIIGILAAVESVKTSFIKSHTFAFRVNATNSISHELLLLTGMWLLLIQKRSVGISTFLTVVVNLMLIYDLTFHLLGLLIYATEYKTQMDGPFWFYLAILFPLMVLYHVFSSYYYFSLPYSEMLTETTTSELPVYSLVLCYMLVITLAVYLHRLHIRKEMKSSMAKDL